MLPAIEKPVQLAAETELMIPDGRRFVGPAKFVLRDRNQKDPDNFEPVVSTFEEVKCGNFSDVVFNCNLRFDPKSFDPEAFKAAGEEVCEGFFVRLDPGQQSDFKWDSEAGQILRRVMCHVIETPGIDDQRQPWYNRELSVDDRTKIDKVLSEWEEERKKKEKK